MNLKVKVKVKVRVVNSDPSMYKFNLLLFFSD